MGSEMCIRDSFGPEGSEIGGVFSVSDTDVGTIEIRGAFVGKRD